METKEHIEEIAREPIDKAARIFPNVVRPSDIRAMLARNETIPAELIEAAQRWRRESLANKSPWD
jgi:hypothetical protein